ncbi:MAG: hypothetical protein WC554_10615 [Clostridia bacterium]|jgi:hypothetical protein
MPYIEKKKRTLYDDYIHAFELMHAATVTDGELNYLISSLVHSVIKKRGLKYGNVNAVIGVLECVKQELYRKVASPYEDKKAAENGAVSILDMPGQGSYYTPEQRKGLEDTR